MLAFSAVCVFFLAAFTTGQEYGGIMDQDYGRSVGRRSGGRLSTILSTGGVGSMGGVVKTASVGGMAGGLLPGGLGTLGVGSVGGAVLPGTVGMPGVVVPGAGLGVGGVGGVVKTVSAVSASSPLTGGMMGLSTGYCPEGSMGASTCSGDYECGQMQYCYLAAGLGSFGTCCIRQQTIIGGSVSLRGRTRSLPGSY